MHKYILLLFALLSLSFAQYSQTVCGECGKEAPRQCAELLISEMNCSTLSASFACRKEETREGWIFCPACPDGYSLLRCDSGWFFGLFKTSFCTMNYSAQCGQYCQQDDNVLSRTTCSIKKKQECCEIPTNIIQILSPAANMVFYRNESVNFMLTFSGAVKNISIDYGDGRMDWESPTQSGIAHISHIYFSTGDFGVVARAYSCNNCSHRFNSSDTLNITVKYKR